MSLRALLLTSAPLAGICSGSSLLMAHLAAPLSRRALLLCFFQVSGLADGVRPFAFSHVFSCSFFPVALFRSLFSDSPSCCAEKRRKNEKISSKDEKNISDSKITARAERGGHSEVRMYSNTFLFFILFFLRYFSLFELAGWPKRAIIARGSQRVSEGYCCALSPPLTPPPITS